MSNGKGYDVKPLVIDDTAVALATAVIQMEAAMKTLQQTLDQVCAGHPPWGTDEPGQKFGESYVPVAAKAFPALKFYCDQLRYAATTLSQGAAEYQKHDANAAKAIKGVAKR